MTGHFKTLKTLILVVFVALMFLTWYCTNKADVNNTSIVSKQAQMQIKDVNNK